MVQSSSACSQQQGRAHSEAPSVRRGPGLNDHRVTTSAGSRPQTFSPERAARKGDVGLGPGLAPQPGGGAPAATSRSFDDTAWTARAARDPAVPDG